MAEVKLGKRPATAPRVRPLRHLLAGATMPALPASTNRTPLVPQWHMLGNDAVGDCVEAGGCHAVDLMTAAAGAPRVASRADAITMYEQAAGYVPGEPKTDQGTNMQDFLQRWSGPGYTIAGEQDRIAGFQSLSPTDLTEIRESVAWLGGALVGLALPIAYETMVDPSQPFDIPTGQSLSGDWAYGSAGGHCVLISDYDPDGFTVITWGAPKRMTFRFWLAYGDEAYALLDRDFAAAAIPEQAWAKLEQDMAALKAA